MDTSGSWGCGALWDGQWLQVAWSEWPSLDSANISAKELLPVVVAAATWGFIGEIEWWFAIVTTRQWWQL